MIAKWTTESVPGFVFTLPKTLRRIFRMRCHFLDLLFQTTVETLRDACRTLKHRTKTAAIKSLGKAEPVAMLQNNLMCASISTRPKNPQLRSREKH